jgi:hypothetical protein
MQRWAELRKRAFFIIPLSILLIAGCRANSPQKVQAKPEDPRRHLNELQERVALFEKKAEDVFVRKVTPYDADPSARQAYLDHFYAGYQMAQTGYFATYCLLGGPHGNAYMRGWYDGQGAGSMVWATNESRASR